MDSELLKLISIFPVEYNPKWLDSHEHTCVNCIDDVSKVLPRAQGDWVSDYLYDNDLLMPTLGPLEYPINLEIIGYKGDVFDFVMIMTNFISSVTKCKTLKDFFMPVFTLVSQISHRTYTEVLKRFARPIYAIFHFVFGYMKELKYEIFNNDEKEFSEFISEQKPDMQSIMNAYYMDKGYHFPSAQDSDVSQNLDEFWRNLKEVHHRKQQLLSSEFANRFSSFCGMIVALPIFGDNLDLTTMGFSKAFAYRMKKRYRMDHPILLMDNILETVIFFADRVKLAIDKKDWAYLYVDDAELIDYDKKYALVMHYFDRLSLLPNVVKEGSDEPMTLDDYHSLVEQLCSENKLLQKSLKHDQRIKATLKAQMMCLEKCKLKCRDKQKVSTQRECPIALVIYSGPGTGKSAVTLHLGQILFENAQYHGRSTQKFDRKLVYFVNPNDKYLSEFRSDHKMLVMDDTGQFRPKIDEANGGGSIAQTCNFINSTTYVTEQPGVEDKGMIPMLIKYLIVTTNVRDAGISDVFREESGAKRRYIFLDKIVRPEYREPGTTQLRGDSDPTNHDLWLFIPRKYKNVNGRNNEVKWDNSQQQWVPPSNEVPWMSMKEIQIFLRDHVQGPHYEKADVEKECVEHFMQSGLCEICGVNSSYCDCPDTDTESDDESIPSNSSREYSDEEKEMIKKDFQSLQREGPQVRFRPRRKLPFAQSGFRIDAEPWIRSFYRAFGFKGIMTLIGYRILEHWNMFKSNISDLYKKHRKKCHMAIGITGLITTLVLVRKAIKWYYSIKKSNIFDEFEPKEQGDVPSKIDSQDVAKQNNPWIVSYEDAERVTGKPTTTTIEKLRNTISHNCVNLVAEFGSQYCTIGALGIHGHTIIVPKHWYDTYKDEWEHVSIVRHVRKAAIGPTRHKIYLDDSCVELVDGQDYVYISHPGFGLFRDIRPYLLPARFKGMLEGEIIGRDKNGEIFTNRFNGLQAHDFNYITRDEVILHCRGYFCETFEPTLPGQCGAAYIVKTLTGVFIAGIHIAGGQTSNGGWHAYCQPVITGQVIEPKCASYNGLSLVETYPRCQKEFIPVIHPKDPIIEASGCVTVFGDTQGFRPKIKSDVCDTLMNEEVREHYGLIENSHTSPKGCSYRKCLLDNYNKVGEKASFPPKEIKFCRDAVYSWFERRLEEENIIIPNEPYDRFVGINGIDGDPYINRLPVNTSAGFTRGGRKDKYLVNRDPDLDHYVKYDLDDDTFKEYNLLITRYERGEKGQVIWNYNFKDEPISWKKHAASKVRLFNAGPLAFNVLFRQYFAWTIPIFSGKNNYKFASAIGTNCFSKDWEVLYNYITTHGFGRIIAGDYEGFDKKQPAEVLWAVFEILFRIARKFGWSDYHIKIMKGLATDICYSTCNVFGTLIELQGNNPSGNPLTTILNGIVNVMYIMLACRKIAKDNNITHIRWEYFQDYVSILTYGDDNIMSSSIDEFNHTNIADALRFYGLGYTMADKTSESVPFINIEDAEFLKRKFVVRTDELGGIACPLDEKSIIKSLHVCTKSRSITFQQQMAEIIRSANHEYFQYGRAKFEYEHKFLENLLDQYKLRSYLPNGKLLSYDEVSQICA